MMKQDSHITYIKRSSYETDGFDVCLKIETKTLEHQINDWKVLILQEVSIASIAL